MLTIVSIFEHYGRIAALCQRLEVVCVTKLMLIEGVTTWERGNRDSAHRERMRKLSNRTFGQGVDALAVALDLPEWKEAVQPAISARNHLHHSFFLEFDPESSGFDISAAATRLQELEEVLQGTYELVCQAAEPLFTAFENATGSSQPEEEL